MSSTAAAATFPSHHADYVNDVRFDFYGRRVATASNDRTVKVWEVNPDTSEWTIRAGCEWQAHRSGVRAVSWAHPEYGQILATAGGRERAVTIWEESGGGSIMGQTTDLDGGYGIPETAPGSRWTARAYLADARKDVTCLEFAPKGLGLRIAVGSADGFFRVYEAIDVQNLGHWSMVGQVDCTQDDIVNPLTASDGQGSHQGGVGFGEGESSAQQQQGSSSAQVSELGIRSLSWCNGRFEPPTIVVGGSSGFVGVYRYSDASRQWFLMLRLADHGRGGCLDVAWAPNVGRSYHLIASSGKDNVLRLHRLKRERKKPPLIQVSARDNHTSSHIDSSSSANLSTLEHESSVVLEASSGSSNLGIWRCEWNITGTCLATSGDMGLVKLWKSGFHNSWKCVEEVHGNLNN